MAIGEVAHVPDDVEAASQPPAGRTKANAVNPARKQDAPPFQRHEFSRCSVRFPGMRPARSPADPRKRDQRPSLASTGKSRQVPETRAACAVRNLFVFQGREGVAKTTYPRHLRISLCF